MTALQPAYMGQWAAQSSTVCVSVMVRVMSLLCVGVCLEKHTLNAFVPDRKYLH